MNCYVHRTAGFLVGGGTYAALKKYEYNEQPDIVGCFVYGLLGSLIAELPDILEPANNPNHRGFYHSAAFIGISGYLLYRLFKNGNVSREWNLICKVAAATYGSHLVLDSSTPRGLPFIKNNF
ncbi:MAG: metal-dependent hydrolase [Candidatus Zixiibacteriota bacterium]